LIGALLPFFRAGARLVGALLPHFGADSHLVGALLPFFGAGSLVVGALLPHFGAASSFFKKPLFQKSPLLIFKNKKSYFHLENTISYC
jgi:hypothetical protein